MKSWPPRRRARHIRVPAFSPVPLRARADGWTPLRQAAFLAELALTGSVCEAARRVGIARETASRLRARPGAESFAAAWDAVLGKADMGPRKGTTGELAQRALGGLLKPLIYRGKHVLTIENAGDSATLRLIGRHDRARRRHRAAGGKSQGFASEGVSTKGEGECR